MDWPSEAKLGANWGYNSSPLLPQTTSHHSDCSVDLRLGSHLAHFGSDPHPLLQTRPVIPTRPTPVQRRQREREVYCLVEGCNADLSKSRDYHRKHKVCEVHSKTAVVIVGGKEQRFCQQCSRFHSVAEFDAQKRSCRKRLLFHNRRRRKPLQDDSLSSRGLFANHHGARLSSYQQIYSTIDSTPDPFPFRFPLRNDQSALHASSALNLTNQTLNFNSSTFHQPVPVADRALSLLSGSSSPYQPTNNLQICHSLQMQENSQFHGGLNVSVMHVSEGVSVAGFYNGLYQVGEGEVVSGNVGNVGISLPFSWQ